MTTSTTSAVRSECITDGCTLAPIGRRLCRKHYNQARSEGRLDEYPRLSTRSRDASVVCPPDHEHGATTVCYIQHGCGCTACVENRVRVERRRRRELAYGRWDTGLVDADPVRAHLDVLAAFGIGYKRAARLAGVSPTTVRTLIYGRADPGREGEMPKRTKLETAEALLAVKPDISNLAAASSIPARGTHRRLQALVAIGWSLTRLADRLGMSVSNLITMMTRRDQVTVATHRAVAALFDELWATAPPRAAWHDAAAYSRARNYARERRWLPPLAWDDPDTDPEPRVTPATASTTSTDGDETATSHIDEIAIDLACEGERVRLTTAERHVAVTRLHNTGHSAADIATLLGVAERTVVRDRRVLNLPPIAPHEDRKQTAA